MSDERTENTDEIPPIRTVAESLEPIDASSSPETKKPEPAPAEPKPAGIQPENMEPRKKSGAGAFAGIFVIVISVVVIVAAYWFFSLMQEQERSNQAMNHMAMGREALVDGDLGKGLVHFTDALELDPGIEDANAALGQIAIAFKDGTKAVEHFNAELEINPDDRQSHLALGCLYALGAIEPGDPNRLKPYLLSRYPDILPFAWPIDLAYIPDPGESPYIDAVYHFNKPLEHLPDDPMPIIGLALTDIAAYNLPSARQRLSNLTASVEDEATLITIYSIIEDINEEEQNQAFLMAQYPDEPVAAQPGPIQPSTPGEDYTGELTPMPPIAGESPSTEGESGFGSRVTAPADLPGSEDGESGFSTTMDETDFSPQPSVKPVSHDIPLSESGEWVHTTRIANIYQQGSVGFRVGETIVMPNTNVEVTVVQSSEELIVLSERGYDFYWIPGEVGWRLDQAVAAGTSPDEGLDITATFPSDDVSEDIEDPDDTEDSTGDEETTETELGPEVG